MNSLNYSRRRALFTSSKGSYFHTSLGSRDSLESPDEDGESSISGISTQSTRSLKSYRSWRKSQKQRRQLRRAQTIGVFDTKDTTLDALDLSGEFGSTTPKRKENEVFETAIEKHTSTSIDIKPDEARVEEKESLVAPSLATIIQSPLEPFYSSSSSLESSPSHSDEFSTPRRTPRSESDIDELEDSEIQRHFKESFNNRKDPLQRRSYPFIFQESELYSFGEEDNNKPTHRQFLAPPSIRLTIQEQRRRSSDGEISGLNAISSIAKPQSLLQLAKSKSSVRKMSDTIYEEQENEQPDIVFAETNGFTVSLPMHSPTVPSHMLGDDTAENTSGEASEIFFKEHQQENEKIQSIMNASRRRRAEWRRLNSEDDILDVTDDLPHQKALETDPGIYFLPPLIAKAIEKHTASVSDDTSHLFERDRNSNLTIPQKSEKGDLRGVSSASSTQEATDDENVYLENADDLFDDLRESDYTTPPSRRAFPEPDTSSITTKDSIDPIEEILLREDDLPADDRTFTLNGKSVITPTSHKQDKEECQIEAVSVQVAEAPAPEAHRDLDDLVAKKEEASSAHDMAPGNIHSHKVGKGSKCTYCNNKRENKMPTLVEETKVVGKTTNEIESEKPVPEKQTLKPKKPIHSHKVGDDAKCEYCSPKNGETDTSDLTSILCCSIL